MAFLNEMPYGKGILVGISTGEALVCHIKEWIMLLLFYNIADLLPLLLGRIDTGRVVSAGMQQDDRLLRGSSEISNHAFEIETNGVLVVVFVLLDLQTRVLEDSIVICPARGRDVDRFSMWIEALEEGATYPESSCS